ncbi:RNF13-like protein [Mya arenaria]|uniref:RNF13-like protein n=1 Tax=Mya arenaria TaxID=6604 RepID=A0ABY7G340_MYAAR|nr:RNF13-like protein [Mya arenaria]
MSGPTLVAVILVVLGLAGQVLGDILVRKENETITYFDDMMSMFGPSISSKGVRVRNVQNWSVAAIVYNHRNDDKIMTMHGDGSDIIIPSVFVGWTDGELLRTQYCFNCLNLEHKSGTLSSGAGTLTVDATYHTKCIDPWLTKNKRSCPICKRKVFPGDDPDTESDSSDDERPTERTPLLGNSSEPSGQTNRRSTFDSSEEEDGDFGNPGDADDVMYVGKGKVDEKKNNGVV